MVPYYRVQVMEDARNRLDKVLSGETATGLTLPAGLKKEIKSMQKLLAESMAKYGLLQRQDEQARLALLATQQDAVLFLRRIRQVVGAHLSPEVRQAVRRQYGLSEVRSYGQARLLQLLSNIKAISDDLEDAELKLSEEAVTTAETLSQSLQDGLKKRRHLQTQKISLRKERMDILKQFRRLRTRIYAFLMENMPSGSRDERLIDFGFRPSIMRRNPRSGEEVTVVTESEISEVAPVVETPVPVE